jgi:hypothetical protein
MAKSNHKYFQSKFDELKGSDYLEIFHKAHKIYAEIARTTKRSPYVRSVYFSKQKVFLKTQWDHIYQKNNPDRQRRLKYYAAAIDLIRNSTCEPTVSYADGNKLFKFYGKTKSKSEFIVQIKQDNKNGKYHMSQFPPRHQK